MRLVQLGRWIRGWVQVEAEGGYPERFLNALPPRAAIWGMRRREEVLRFSCAAAEYPRFRRAARRAGLRMRVRRKLGFPFTVRRYRRRYGLLVGVALYAAILMWLAPRIWVIDVSGNSETPTREILDVVEEMGVRIGGSMKEVSIKSVEITGLDRLPTLAWITVNPSGCVARVEVMERRPTPTVLDLSRPSDMVALLDGRILSMDVFSGSAAVKPGSAVKAGELLISGRTETELGQRLYRSYGEVIAETERQITVTVPLVYEKQTADGYVACCPTFHFLGLEFPLYSGVPQEENYLCVRREHFLTAEGRRLPLGFVDTYYIRQQSREAVRTRQQAERLALAELERREKKLFADCEATETHRRWEVSSGELILTVTYSCRENIALEVPIDGETAAETDESIPSP